MAQLKRIGESTKVVSSESKWNGLNVLHNEASRAGLLDLGIQSNADVSLKGAKLVYLLGADNIREEDIPEDAFVIYQGHHGDEGAYFADLILPGAAYTEKTGIYVNTEGRVQMGRGVVQSPMLAKEDWKILRALSEELGAPLPYDSTDELRNRLSELAPHLMKNDYVEPHTFEDLSLKNRDDSAQMNNAPFASNIDNFYQTDAISRNSSVMAKCTKEFNPRKHKNFRPPVYGVNAR